jgi:calpain-15
MPGHAYSIIRVVEYEGNHLVNIRNPWGTFEWEGAWSDKDRTRWTDDAIQSIQPVFGDDGTFWMCFQDFHTHFTSVSVCKVRDWEEVRVKCEFTNFPNS